MQRDPHVPVRLELTVRLQPHASAQVIPHERQVRLGEPELPWAPGVLDGRER